MTTRYLFRAKQSSDGTWISGCGVLERKQGTVLIYSDKDRYTFFETYVEPSTVCQCTGWKDKTKGLIFEHDVVRCSFDGQELIGVVYWDAHNADYEVRFKNESLGLGYMAPYMIEAIGNIFDNPDLLEGELLELFSVDNDECLGNGDQS